MCIAIVTPKGCPVPFAHLQEGFVSNPHGAGFAYAKNGKVIIEKGFFTFNSFWKAFKDLNGQVDAMVHFRWATHGAHNALNCHPWRIDDEHAMMHNGTLEDFTGFKNGLSDTGNFNKLVLQPMFQHNKDVWKQEWCNQIISQAITSPNSSNKMAIIGGDGTTVIYNEHLGNWSQGVWYSNYDYVKPKRRNKKVVAA